MKPSVIKLTEEGVRTYWEKRAEKDGIRTTGHCNYTLAGQDERYKMQKKFVFTHCPRHLRTLDYGCGIGRFAEDFEHYLGVDFTEFVPIVKGDILFGLYENTEIQKGHMRGRKAEDYVGMVSAYFKIYEWETHSHRMSEEHAFTLIKGGCK